MTVRETLRAVGVRTLFRKATVRSSCSGGDRDGRSLADSGPEAVERSRVRHGPSAILLALMASGMNGQRFSFHGYLPVEAAARAAKIRELEQRSKREDATQIFIETPYRNDQLLEALLEHCTGNTLLCIAADLTQPAESVATRTVASWRNERPALNKRPAVFLLYRNV